MAWSFRGLGTRAGYEPDGWWILHQNLPPNKPKEEKKQLQKSEKQGKKEKHWSSCSLDLNVYLFCAEMHPRKMCLWQLTNSKWSKKSTVQRQPQTLLLLPLHFSLLQKVIRNMHADAKIETVWSFITWLSNWCKMKYLLAAPVAIAPHVAMLAHLAGFGP